MSMDPKKRVAAASQRPENQHCADCGCKLLTSSIWASSTLGIFICINCSGRHRNLGTHITFVRSVGLDSWTDEQATVMETIGNKVSNEYWEATIPKDYPRPATEDLEGLTKFIRMKYELAKWADKTRKPPNIALMEQKKPSSGKRSKAAKMAQSKSSNSVTFASPGPVQRSNSTNLFDLSGSQPTIQQSNSVDMLFGAPTTAAPAPVSNSASFGLSYSSNQQNSFISSQPPVQPVFNFNQPAAQPSFDFNKPAAQPVFDINKPAAKPAPQPAFGFNQPAQQQRSFDPFAQATQQQQAADPRKELKNMLASSGGNHTPPTSTEVFRQSSHPSTSNPSFNQQAKPIRGGPPKAPKAKNDAFSGISPF